MSGAHMFGELVRAHRRRLGLTQEELAEKAGVSVRSIGKIEANQIATPRPATVRLLADGLGLHGGNRERFCASATPAGGHRDATSARHGAPVEPGTAVNDAELIPRQLPAITGHFVGRAHELAVLNRLANESPHAAAPVISMIAGTPGIGKSTLAVHWAHEVADRFPDGQLYVNLRGFDPGTMMSSVEAVRGFLDALAVPPQRIPVGVHAQAALYRSLLANRRMLVVLDNAHDADQVRPLLPASPACLVVVTSRNRLTSLVAVEGAQLITLDLLSTHEARQLLSQRLGQHRIVAEPLAADEIIAQCARLPLALAVVAARAAVHRDFALTSLADELREARTRLDTLSGDDSATNVRAVFSCSYQTLSVRAARLFRLLGLHPGPDISLLAAASLAGLPAAGVRPLLDELTRAHLVTERSPGRYLFHDLLRVYAADLARRIDVGQRRRAATHRLLDHYLHTAYAADRRLYPFRDPITLGAPHTGTTPEDLADFTQALAWFTREHAVLLAAVDHAANGGWDRHTWQLSWTLATFLMKWQHWHDLAVTQRAAAVAAGRLADLSTQAHAHRYLGHAYTNLGRFSDAGAHIQQALELSRQAGDEIEQAYVHLSHAILWEEQSRYVEAVSHAQQALALFQATGHRTGVANTLNIVGWYHAHLGEYRRALTMCQRALTLLQDLGNRDAQASAWDSLGYAHYHLGDYAEAATSYQHAIDMFRERADRYQEATALTKLGDVHDAAGDRDAARAAWHDALIVLTDLDHPDTERVRRRLQRLSASFNGARTGAGCAAAGRGGQDSTRDFWSADSAMDQPGG